MRFSVSLVAATVSLIAAAILVMAPRPKPTRALEWFIYRISPGDPGGAVIRENIILFFTKDSPHLEVPRFNDLPFEADPEWKRIMQNRPVAFQTEQWRRFIAQKGDSRYSIRIPESTSLVNTHWITPSAGNA